MKDNRARMFIETPPHPRLKPVKPQKKTLERRSLKVWNFLEKRRHLTINRLAEDIGFDISNFNKYRQAKRKIPEKYLKKLEEIFTKLYGYEK